MPQADADGSDGCGQFDDGSGHLGRKEKTAVTVPFGLRSAIALLLEKLAFGGNASL